ncbi:MAG: HAD-IA family hydrolase [Acidimicrobiia bacterium]
MPVEGVVFDIGGVLLPERTALGRMRWAARLDVEADQFNELVWGAINTVGLPYEIDDVASVLRADTGLDAPDVALLLADFNEHWVLEDRLEEFLGRLRPRYRTGILTNAPAGVRFATTHRLALDRLVNAVVISGEEGVEKPDERIYRLMTDRLGVDAEQCVFIDDRLDNVEGARAVGMSALEFVSVGDTLAWLRRELQMIETQYAAAGGVVIEGDEVLVLRRPERDEIRLPKGHIEANESPADTAVREVGEESGYVDAVVTADLGIQVSEFDAFPDAGPGWHVTRDEHYYRMRLRTGRRRAQSAGDEKFTPVWLPVEEARAALTFPIERRWLERALTV